MSDKTTFYLASSSPRRQQLLESLGYDFSILSFQVDESQIKNEKPSEYVQRVAEAKAKQGLALRPDNQKPVLAADTAVIIDDLILGKPHTRQEAISMLKKLSGREHRVLTAVCVALTTEYFDINLSESTVYFKSLLRREIEAYCDTLEPYDKAGSYAIQGLAASFIFRIEGSYSGIMGLPIFEVVEMLRKYNVDLLNVS